MKIVVLNIFELTIRLLCTQEESTITRKLRMLRKSEQLEFQMPRPQGETMESKSPDHVMIHELHNVLSDKN